MSGNAHLDEIERIIETMELEGMSSVGARLRAIVQGIVVERDGWFAEAADHEVVANSLTVELHETKARLAEAEARAATERDAGYQAALDDVLKAIANIRGDAGIARLVSSGRGEFNAALYDDEDWDLLRDDDDEEEEIEEPNDALRDLMARQSPWDADDATERPQDAR